MRYACRITKATDTNLEYLTLIAVSRQQWLRERTTMLHYTYITSLVINQADCVYKAVRIGSLNYYLHNSRWYYSLNG
jgi:hypothetical protein